MRASFTELHVTQLPCRWGEAPRVRLDEALTFSFGPGGGFSICVPAGSITDYASTPRWLWWLFPPNGPWAPIAAVHDYLYQTGICSRFLADAVLREGMTALGVPLWIRVVMFYAVRAFGVGYWRRKCRH